MRSAVEKSSKETRSRAAASHVSEKKDRGTGTLHVADHGAEAIQRRKLEQMADNSPQAGRAAQLRSIIDNSARVVAQRQQFERFFGGAAQREALPEEEELQMKAKAAIQAKGLEEEELLQGKFPATETPGQVKDSLDGPANETGLPDQLKAGVENLSGISMDDVKVHYNSARPVELQALAYTQGTDIHVAPGQEQHLAHEAWHVVQQKQGRVEPTMQLKGVDVNADPVLEGEADVMGAKAARGGSHLDPAVRQG